MYFKSSRYNGRRKLSEINLSPVMRKERFYNSLKLSKFTRVVCYEQKNISDL